MAVSEAIFNMDIHGVGRNIAPRAIGGSPQIVLKLFHWIICDVGGTYE